MLPDLKLVIRLQEIDKRLVDLLHEIAALPKHIAEIETKLVSHERKLEADRAALLMHAQDGMPHAAIARALGLSLAAVKVRVHRARIKLRRMFDPKGG